MIFQISRYFLLTAILFLFSNCEKVDYFETNSETFDITPKALVHAASGDTNFAEQSLEAVDFGFSILDGIEVDIQISEDNTLWLSHDSKVKATNDIELGYFCKVPDYKIEAIYNANGSSYYTKLDSVFTLMNKKYPDKHISLDIKRPFKISAYSSYDAIYENISDMVLKYGLEGKVLIESSSKYLLKQFVAGKANIETYYFCLGDFDKGVAEAIYNNFTGISFKINSYDILNRSLIETLHSAGLKIQVFYTNEVHDIKRLHSYGVDFMQTDNLEFYSALKD